MMRLHHNQTGVTLVELMIATLVFSVVLLIIIGAFLFVSSDYIKGYVQAQTQETARATIQQVTQDLQLDNGQFTPSTSNGGLDSLCIGSHFYSFQLDSPIGSSGATHALVASNGCSSSPQPLTSAQGSELLRNHMRLGDFYVHDNGNGSFTINLTVAYGDKSASNDILSPVAQTRTFSDGTQDHYYTYKCPQINLGGNFCAISTLSATVNRRVSAQGGS